MDFTPLEHILIALAIQAAFGFGLRNWLAGWCAGAFLFIGREHAQAEYFYIEHFANGVRADAPIFFGFYAKSWGIGNLLDFVLPVVACGLVYLIATNFTRGKNS